jgi:NADPH:quinone reductase-like Zn-dependent oxidoreductase
MKAMVWTQYGPPNVLQLKEVDKPTPKDNEVLIKVHAATVTLADCELRRLRFAAWSWMGLPVRILLGFRKPKRRTILGQELAGEIEAVGGEVTWFKEGDQIFAPTLLHLGAYAEYVCLPETYPVLKPANITYEDAATIPTGGINGLHFLRIANVHSGQRVLINGAGGSIGTYAVQIAKSLGAEVTAVDSKEKLAMLRSIGADYVIDYAQEDFTKSGETYDVIIDVVGKSSFSGSVRSLKPNGRYVLGNPSLSGIIRRRLTPMTLEKKVLIETASYRPEYYAFLKELMEAGEIKSVIDRRYPLEQLAEAHRYVDDGYKKGNVVITVAHHGK